MFFLPAGVCKTGLMIRHQCRKPLPQWSCGGQLGDAAGAHRGTLGHDPRFRTIGVHPPPHEDFLPSRSGQSRAGVFSHPFRRAPCAHYRRSRQLPSPSPLALILGAGWSTLVAPGGAQRRRTEREKKPQSFGGWRRGRRVWRTAAEEKRSTCHWSACSLSPATSNANESVRDWTWRPICTWAMDLWHLRETCKMGQVLFLRVPFSAFAMTLLNDQLINWLRKQKRWFEIWFEQVFLGVYFYHMSMWKKNYLWSAPGSVLDWPYFSFLEICKTIS